MKSPRSQPGSAYDVRDFVLLAIGGGGPLCGAFMADVLGMKEVVVPRFAGSFCAWSMLALLAFSCVSLSIVLKVTL